jgi:short-subunit dehydrogenase
VNNAGFGTNGYFWEIEVASQEQMHRLHVIATMRLTHSALANLVPRGTGGVINVASVAGFAQSPKSVSYCATKTWINSFTEGLAMELSIQAPSVKVQALCPGFTLSEFHDVLGADRSAIAKSLWMSADFVVEESLRGFDHGKTFVIPGWRYKLIVTAMKLMPGALMRRVSTGAAKRMRKPLTKP